MKKIGYIIGISSIVVVIYLIYNYINQDNIFIEDKSANIIKYNEANCKKDDCLILINESNVLDNEVTNEELMEINNGEFINKLIYEDLQQMFDVARSENIYPTVKSGYRSKKDQEELYLQYYNSYREDGFNKEEAIIQTEYIVAKPNTSEHQLGISVDIVGETSTNKEVYDWLNDNAYKYGFILRYPINKEEVTGLNYEPWHYRYVGKEHSLAMYNNNLCLEEYI